MGKNFIVDKKIDVNVNILDFPYISGDEDLMVVKVLVNTIRVKRTDVDKKIETRNWAKHEEVKLGQNTFRVFYTIPNGVENDETNVDPEINILGIVRVRI